MSGPPAKKPQARDPLLDMADAIEKGSMSHAQLRAEFSPTRNALKALADLRGTKDMGWGPATALGIAHGMSAGLDVPARSLGTAITNRIPSLGLLLPTATDQSVAQTTANEHGGAFKVGTAAGAIGPLLLAGPLGATPAGAGTLAAVNAAQGFGLTDGDVPTRMVGAAGGAFLGRYGPTAAKAIGSRIPFLNRLAMLRRAIPSLAEGAPAAEAPAAAEAASSVRPPPPEPPPVGGAPVAPPPPPPPAPPVVDMPPPWFIKQARKLGSDPMKMWAKRRLPPPSGLLGSAEPPASGLLSPNDAPTGLLDRGVPTPAQMAAAAPSNGGVLSGNGMGRSMADYANPPVGLQMGSGEAAQQESARAAYNLVQAATGSDAQALEAARRSAGYSHGTSAFVLAGLLGPAIANRLQKRGLLSP